MAAALAALAALALAAVPVAVLGTDITPISVGDEFLEMDLDGDGALDGNLVVARTAAGAAAIVDLCSRTRVRDGDIEVATMSGGEEMFEAVFHGMPDNELDVGEWDFVFVRKGTDTASVDALFDAAELPGWESDENVKRDLLEWLQDCQRAEVGWVNFERETFDMYWLEGGGANPTRVHVGELEPGEQRTQWRSSFLGHRFVLVGQQSGTELDYQVATDEFHTVGEFPSLVGGREAPAQQEYDDLFAYEMRRAARIKRKFTDTGYKRMRVPRKLFADIRRWWNVNRAESFVEDWAHKGLYVNWWAVDAKMIPPPHSMTARWGEWFKPVLEEWSQETLEFSGAYGVRTYFQGAELASHVDRETTHAVSAIINVEQPEMDVPWQLAFYDVNGKQGWYDMDQGDAMLYESALCMHGRPRPLQGKYYANVFFHYRPVGDPAWFRKVNNINVDSEEKYGKPDDDYDENIFENEEDDDEGDGYGEEHNEL